MATTAKIELTGRELDALHETLAIVLNDPDWWSDRSTQSAIARVSDKVVRLLLNAKG